jgi:hypothetical protein
MSNRNLDAEWTSQESLDKFKQGNLFKRSVNLHGSMHDVRARRLWQVLFDFYREKGGDLKNLDNLLIDYTRCFEVLNNLHQPYVGHSNEKTIKLLFCVDAGNYTTSLEYFETSEELKPPYYIDWFDHKLEVVVTYDNIEATEIVKQ